MTINTISLRRQMSCTPAAALQSQAGVQEEPAWLPLARSAMGQTPVTSSLMTDDSVEDAEGAFFEVPARHPNQKPILFGRYRGEELSGCEPEEDCGNPDY